MTQAQMAHAQWEASRAAPVQVSSYTAGYRPHQAATAESYDFGHALQRPAVQQQQPGYAAPYQLRRSVSLDPSRTPPPPRLNPGSPAFAPRSPPAVGGRARAREPPRAQLVANNDDEEEIKISNTTAPFFFYNNNLNKIIKSY